MSLECEHGQLARSCNICEYEREIAELKARVGELEAENKRLKKELYDAITNGRVTKSTYDGTVAERLENENKSD